MTQSLCATGESWSDLYDTVSKWHSLYMTQSRYDTVSKWHSLYMTQSLYDTVSLWHSVFVPQNLFGGQSWSDLYDTVSKWHNLYMTQSLYDTNQGRTYMTQYLYDTVSKWHSLDMPQCLNVSIWHSLLCYAWGTSRLCHLETVSFRTVSYRDCVI